MKDNRYYYFKEKSYIPPRKISRYQTPVEATSKRNRDENNKAHKASHVIAANKNSEEGA